MIAGLFRRILVGLGQKTEQCLHDRKIGSLHGRLQGLFHPVVAGDDRRIVGVHEPAGCLPGIGLPFKPGLPALEPLLKIRSLERGGLRQETGG